MIIDGHVHLNKCAGDLDECVENLLRCADKFHIERLCLSLGFAREHQPTPEQICVHNAQVRQAIAKAPDRFIGFVYLNPLHRESVLREIEKHVVNGPMRGIKLWVACRCSDPCLDPLVERAVGLDLPILQHTWLKATGNLPFESTPDDLAALARRHPRAKLILGHTGGDWEYGIMAVRDLPNVYADLSGGAPTAGLTELARQEMGAERLLYGSDAPSRSFASQIAKVYGAAIPPREREMILGKNMARLLHIA